MTKQRNIFFLTGARSEYDLMMPVIQAVSEHPDLTEGVIASAAHLSPFHGNNIDAIRADGFEIVAELETLVSSESWTGRSLSFAHLTTALTHFLASNRPDVLFIAGDREEALAGAIVANFLGIFVAHLHGGDRCIASDIDEVLRPAISKLAHLHFAATEGHRQRLIKMGEPPAQVWASGAPGLDRLLHTEKATSDEIFETYQVDISEPYILIIHHPSSTLPQSDAVAEMEAILNAVVSLGIPAFCSYPNFDPGNIAMRQTIDQFRENYAKLIVFHNLPRTHFVTIYSHSTAIVGNSSSIVIESTVLKIPGILVGSRQDLREIAANVQRVAPDEQLVKQAILQAMNDEDYQALVQATESIYGDGKAANRIVNALATVELSPAMLLKTITY